MIVVFVLTAANAAGLIWFVRRFGRYIRRQEELFSGEEVKNIEELLLKQKKTLATHHKNLKELGEILEELVEGNRFNVQRVGLVRFNPFGESGGNMSFALALLTGDDNGIVISSLHNRDGTRIYAKKITRGVSDHHLTDEEKQAIINAKTKDQKSK